MQRPFANLFAIAAAALHAAASSGASLGVCAHLHRVADAAERAEECRAIAAAGFGRVRFDLSWRLVQKTPDAPFDFSLYDAAVSDAEGAGLPVLPILGGAPKWATPVWEHPDEWGRFVGAVVEHFGTRFPDLEIWNEPNLKSFWKPGPGPDPAKYLAVLRAARAAAKAARPETRVWLGGLSGVPLDYLRAIYELGGGDAFDAVCVHPYCHPASPEGNLDRQLQDLRALMAEFGDAEKPVAITEIGWPTHDTRLPGAGLLRAALAVARPDLAAWRVVYAEAETAVRPQGAPNPVAEALEKALPPGSSVESLAGRSLRERLSAGGVDAVVYPFDESFPADTADAVAAFVESGGTLVDFGGMPMWHPCAETGAGAYARDESATAAERAERLRARLRIAPAAWWLDGAFPRDPVKAFPTETATAAGFVGDPAGEPCDRFQRAGLLREGDEFIPLLVAPAAAQDGCGDGALTMREAVAASVTRLSGGTNGCVALCGIRGARGKLASAGEDGQARHLVRALALAFAEGAREVFWYEFRGSEVDPFDSQGHFGLTHSNFSPKPALGAFRNFALARPDGSVQSAAPWRDDALGLYFPQWTRPDGTPAGVVWKTGGPQRMALTLRAAAGDPARAPSFRSHVGRLVHPVRAADGSYLLTVGESPVFFEGAILDGIAPVSSPSTHKRTSP